jgi:hypothetical protein
MVWQPSSIHHMWYLPELQSCFQTDLSAPDFDPVNIFNPEDTPPSAYGMEVRFA